MDERYLETMKMFQNEIAILRDKYNAERHHPHIPHNFPPFSGRVLWIREMYKRILDPMNIFKSREKVFNIN